MLKRSKLIVTACLVSFIAASNMSYAVQAMNVAVMSAVRTSESSQVTTNKLAASEISTKSSYSFILNSLVGGVIAISAVSYMVSLYIQARKHPNLGKDRH